MFSAFIFVASLSLVDGARSTMAIESVISEAGAGFFKKSTGELGTLEYRMDFFSDRAAQSAISPWHDVPFKNNDNFYHFVCEIPKGATKKMEMIKDIDGNPIKQDTKKHDNGTRYLRYITYRGGAVKNYGYLAQTWEDPEMTYDAHFGKLGEGRPGDNDPIDVALLSGKPCQIGDVLPVRLLGGVALLDSNERDWKLLAVRAEENNPTDYDMQVNEVSTWYINYKGIDEGGNPKNKVSTVVNATVAAKVAMETHELWAARYAKKDMPSTTEPATTTQSAVTPKDVTPKSPSTNVGEHCTQIEKDRHCEPWAAQGLCKKTSGCYHVIKPLCEAYCNCVEQSGITSMTPSTTEAAVTTDLSAAKPTIPDTSTEAATNAILSTAMPTTTFTSPDCKDSPGHDCKGWAKHCNLPGVKDACPKSCGACPGTNASRSQSAAAEEGHSGTIVAVVIAFCVAATIAFFGGIYVYCQRKMNKRETPRPQE